LSQLKDLVICDRLFCPQCHPPDRLWNCLVLLCFSYPYQKNLSKITYIISKLQT
jgi:hypothetical protein